MRPIRSHPSSSKPIAQPNPKPQTLIGGKESEKSPMGAYLLSAPVTLLRLGERRRPDVLHIELTEELSRIGRRLGEAVDGVKISFHFSGGTKCDQHVGRRWCGAHERMRHAARRQNRLARP